jgi:ribonuclease HII
MKPPIALILPRRSPRIHGHMVSSLFTTANPSDASEPPMTTKKRKLSTSKAKKPALNTDEIQDAFLPRTKEESLKRKNPTLQIIGVDEAGRGPLAGPVVAAAAIIPTNIPGITDSKKLTKEEDREALYEKIVSSPNARWAVAIADAKRIDEINILQATLESMKAAVQAIIEVPLRTDLGGTRQVKSSSEIEGCYVVCGSNDSTGKPESLDISKVAGSNDYYALIDGNRLPKDMPCDCEAMVKGDSREYCIGAASILAKVTRDRLMHEYDSLYPEYDLAQHKGYPTALHMAKVKEFGASKIHRRTFAPLKHMKLDKDGKILLDE